MPITKASGQAVAVAAKGDLVVGSATNDAAVLGVGSANQVLTVDSSTTTGLKWAAASSGGMTSLASGSLAASSTGVDLQSISADYNELILYINGYSLALANREISVRFNNDSSGGNYAFQRIATNNTSLSAATNENSFGLTAGTNVAADSNACAIVRLPNYKNTSSFKLMQSLCVDARDAVYFRFGGWFNTAAINRITVLTNSTFDAGTYELFGVK